MLDALTRNKNIKVALGGNLQETVTWMMQYL
jgi:hypothetical protein